LADVNDQRKRNIRTALLLAAVAVAFMFSVVAKRMWFS
jgi:hypothetical protein